MQPGKTLTKVHTAVAADVTAGSIKFNFGDGATRVKTHTVQVRTAAGAIKAWDGASAVAGAVVTVDNSGTTDWAATDVVSVQASGI